MRTGLLWAAELNATRALASHSEEEGEGVTDRGGHTLVN